jgi:hypothetical protein
MPWMLFSLLADVCAQEFQAWQLYEHSSKVSFLVRTMTSFHEEFAKSKQTPWLHRYLYKDKMPHTILQAFTTCVMYAGCTRANKTWVFRNLVENTTELLQGQANNPHDKLARAQAMFLYQTIRVFDGDVTLRAQAEKDMPIFEGWLDDLVRIRDNLAEIAVLDDAAVRERPPKSWEVGVVHSS